jgi:hypothetical protein
MKNLKIPKRHALAICKQENALMPTPGYALLLSTGAKLYHKKQGCVSRYWLLGYAGDGMDVERTLSSAGIHTVPANF